MNRILTAAFVVMVGVVSTFANFTPDAVVHVTGSNTSGLTLQAELPTVSDIMSSPDLAGMSIVSKDDEGEISVPAVTRWIALPEGHSPVVRLAARTSQLLDTNGEVLDTPSRDDLDGQSLWPTQPYSVSPVGVYRGVAFAAVTFFPLQLAEDGSGVENTYLNLSVEFSPDASVPVPTPVRDLPGSAAARFLDQMLVNPPQRDPVERQSEYIEHILMVRSTAVDQFVIAYVDSLAQWKRQMGYKVSIWPVDLGQYDEPMIRDYIRENYYQDVDDPINHLIIMGGDSLRLTPYFPPHPTRGDHYYSLMDGGNDPADERISDITVGRMYALSSVEFRGTVKRSILYERQPFLQGGADWFHRALYTAENIAAPGGQFVPSMIQLGRWFWYRWNQMGYNPIDTLYASGDIEQAQQVTRIVRDMLSQQGVSMAISRGWLIGCLDDVEEATFTGRRNPFVSGITCLSAQGALAKFFRDTAINTSTGPIATIAIWGLTKTKTNNCLMGGQMRAMYQFDYWQPGIINNFAKIQLWTDYSMVRESYQEVDDLLSVCRLMGDPSVDVFSDTPDSLHAIHTASLVPGTTSFNIEVSRAGEVASDAVVCVRQGEMSFVAIPGEDGVARFNFPDGLPEGTLNVTITGHNSVPYFASIPVQVQGSDLTVSEWEIDAPHEMYQAGDAIVVNALIVNPGQNAVNNVTASISSESPWISFPQPDYNVGNIAHGGNSHAEFPVNLHISAPDSEVVLINVRLTSGNRIWDESVELMIAAPEIRATGMDFGNGDQFNRGRRDCDILPPLRNNGQIASNAVDAELVSHNPDHIVVAQANAQYGAANPGVRLQMNGQFTVHLDSTAIPGNYALFDLILRGRGNDPFRDTLLLEIPIGNRTASDPLGPDEYGYHCFDSFDLTWNKRPTFDWREINPNEDDAEFEGTDLGMADWREDLDKTTVVALPFPFTYYGEEFDSIAVCTNGWIAFGADKGIFIDFRNTQIPGVLGPDAQLAVFWDDLYIAADWDKRGVYTYFVEDEAIFIVEWSKMQVWQDNSATAQEVQLILRDPAHWPTRSGDGEFVYQYKTFNPAAGNSTDNKYGTIGIKNLDGTGGLQYTYWNEYFENQGVRRIEDGMALLFTTDIERITGSVSGGATLFENPNQAMQGVRVNIPGVASTITDANGLFSLQNVPIGQYTVTFNKTGYNQGRVAVTVRRGENSEAFARLTHPVPLINQQSVDAHLDPGNENGSWPLEVRNEGNGELDFNLKLRYVNGSASELPQRLKVDLVPLNEEFNNFQGVEIVGDHIFVTSVGNGGDPTDNYIIELDKRGNEITRFRQPSISGFGMRDLAWDGTYLWGGEDSLVHQFDRNGNLRRTIRIPVWDAEGRDDFLVHPHALAWNAIDSTLLMGYRTAPIYEMNMQGEIVAVRRFTLPRHTPEIYGLAWNSGDVDGMPLYATIRFAPDGKSVLVAKTNYVESKEVKQLAVYDIEKGSGLAIGHNWEKYTSVAALIATNNIQGNPIDTLRVFELGPDTRGINFDRGMLTVPPGGTLRVWINFSSAGMDTGMYRYSLVAFPSVLTDSLIVPVNYLVRNGAGVSDGELLPEELTLEPAYPNPFNSVTRFGFVLPQRGAARLAVYDLAGREVARLVDQELSAGRYMTVWNAEQMSSGIYFARLELDGASRIIRMTLLK